MSNLVVFLVWAVWGAVACCAGLYVGRRWR